MGERFLKLYGLLHEIQQRAVAALQDRSVPLESLLGAVSQFSVQSSARNQYLGRVAQLIPSASGEIVVSVLLASGLTINASITRSSCERLQLEDQREVIALIKAPAVLLERDGKEPVSECALAGDAEQNCYRAEVINVHEQDLVLRLASGDMLYSRLSGQTPETGEAVIVRIDPEQVMLATITP